MSAYDDLVTAPESRAEVHEDLLALEQELAAARIVGSSADATVSVTVTGNGELVDITITDRALRGSHPEDVGPAIVAALRAARVEAGHKARMRTRSVVNRTADPRPAPRPTRPAIDDGDDLFRGFGAR